MSDVSSQLFWPAALLSHCPSMGSWSVLQVLQHLALTEAEFCRQAAQAVRSGPVYPGRRERMLTIGALFLFRLPLRLSVPSELASLQPENAPDLRSVLANWDDDRNRLRELLLNRSDRETRRVAIHHPLIGAIDWRDGSRFLYVHMQHHAGSCGAYRIRANT